MKEEMWEAIKIKLEKTLENYEIDKKIGQLTTDSLCTLFPTEMQAIIDYINNLQSQLKVKEKAEKEFIKYLEEEINKIKEQINNYNIWHEVGTDINFLILKKQFNMEILSKYKEILSKGENK